MSKENCSVQVTLRADSAPMVNIYAESAADALGIMQEIAALGLNAFLAAWNYEARALTPQAPLPTAALAAVRATVEAPQVAPKAPVAKAAPQHQQRKPVDDFDPDDAVVVPACPKHRENMEYRETKWGAEWECRSTDPDEARGYCRWIRDERGIRRRPTRAELDAAKAANRRGEAVYE